jgi:hypothetical protein
MANQAYYAFTHSKVFCYIQTPKFITCKFSILKFLCENFTLKKIDYHLPLAMLIQNFFLSTTYSWSCLITVKHRILYRKDIVCNFGKCCSSFHVLFGNKIHNCITHRSFLTIFLIIYNVLYNTHLWAHFSLCNT